jgi:hypothetical protein
MKSQSLQQQIVRLTLGCWLAASSIATQPTSSQIAPPTDARQEVLDLDKAWAVAEDKHDEATLRRILDERFLGTFSSGKTYNKEAFLKAILSGDVDPTASQTLSYEAVLIDGDTAVVIGIDTRHARRDGAPYTKVAKYTVTYIRRNDRWVALAEQLAVLPQAK